MRRSAIAGLRLAELICALCQVTDLGMGQPPEGAIRSCLLATSLARHMGVGEQDAGAVYYTTLLQHVGCTAYAYETAALFGGDDIAVRAAGARTDFANPREALSFSLFEVGKVGSQTERASERREVVYARVSILEGPSDLIDEGLRQVREVVLPGARQIDGFRGMIALADRQSGKTLGITFWESEEAMRASEEAASRLREESAEAGGDTIASVERYEVGPFEVES